MSGKQVTLAISAVAPPTKGASGKQKQKKARGTSRSVQQAKQIRLSLSKSITSGAGALVEQYIKSLVDPWNCAPPPAGWGCLVETTIITVFARFTVSNVSGVLAAALIPSAKAMIQSYSAGSTTSTWTVGAVANDAANLSAVTSNAGEGRVLTGGIRATVSEPATNAPGFMYAANPAAASFTQWVASEPQDTINYPGTQVYAGASGAAVTLRPVDPDSFALVQATVDGNGWAAAANTNTTMPVTVPTLVFVNSATSGCSWLLEAVLHIECTPILSRGNLSLFDSGSAVRPSLSDHFPSVERMWKLLSPIVSNAISAGHGPMTDMTARGSGQNIMSKLFGSPPRGYSAKLS